VKALHTLKSDRLPFFSSIFELFDGDKAAEFNCESAVLETALPVAAQTKTYYYYHNKQVGINKETNEEWKIGSIHKIL